MKNIKLFSRSKKDPDTLTARSMILPIAFCLVCGVLLILFGNLALRITAYVLAGVMILCGIWSIIAYMRSKPVQRITESRLATGLILLVAGSLLAFNPNYLEDFLPFIWGLALLFGGFLKIQYAFDEKSVDVKRWWIMLIFAAFSLIVGILSLLNLLGENRNLVIGILLVLEAVLDITVFFLLRHALKKSSQPVAAVTQTFESDTPADESPAESPETPAESPETPAESPAQEVPATEENPAETPAAEDTPATEKE
ncbi:HdeD family acid-resistance protein [Aristaeella lactis]|uniref:Uncharacterized membrane protein HdeD, DUF308 family n=1 Tax=Aristaeella lactis TaxID=3046383 RepID=A0AC61PHT8_9FIRM|nr:DUF308 domain-containing protein [Aristaeella lactis]QUA53530.1 DUF308 domain-containing protein [Aristaeella lactis]SMC36524.1 Uncharacterized membrane protein HdeD, DUF308 family [Aristaeella lactis]